MTVIAEVEFGYDWCNNITDNELIRSMFPDFYEEKEIIMEGPTGECKTGVKEWKPRPWVGNPKVCDESQLKILTGNGVKYNIKRFVGMNPDTLNGDRSMPIPTRGEEIHYHLPNYSLQEMNNVMLLADGCTDELQSLLEQGWRIIAVCPPLNARRPDYVLGRNSKYSN